MSKILDLTEEFIRLPSKERMDILAKFTNIHHDLMKLEKHYQNSICPLENKEK